MYTASIALALGVLLPSTFAAIIEIQVGPGGRNVYEPSSVHAEVGDIINFTFNPKNHTVTQSAFDPPCVPLGPDGFRTGFVPVPNPDEPEKVETRQFTVPDTHGRPLWFYCGQTAHCGQGMVFAINAPDYGDNSFDAHQKLAIARNGTGAAAPSATTNPATGSPAAPNPTYTPPPPQKWETATGTVTWQGSTWLTTYTSYEGTPGPTPGPQPAEKLVIVGPDGLLTYDPPSIQALVGDTVTFEFRTKNHTVTQSSFSNPCEGLVKPDSTLGFKSGFRPVPPGTTSGFPRFSVLVNDTAPIWGYCGQTGHCAAGMVFAINAVETGLNSFGAFQELAKNNAGLGQATVNPSGSGTNAPAPSRTNGGNSIAPALNLMGFAFLAVASFFSVSL